MVFQVGFGGEIRVLGISAPVITLANLTPANLPPGPPDKTRIDGCMVRRGRLALLLGDPRRIDTR